MIEILMFTQSLVVNNHALAKNLLLKNVPSLEVKSKVTLTITLVSVQNIIDGNEVGNIIGNKGLVNWIFHCFIGGFNFLGGLGM